jgi:hypothetical protein
MADKGGYTKQTNPFSPNFGQVPVKFLGRDSIVNDFISGLRDAESDPNRTTIFSGIRGSGKTALLNRIALIAKEHKWIVASVTASDNLLEDIIESAEIEAKRLTQNHAPIESIQVGAFGISAGIKLAKDEQHVSGWRAAMTNLYERLNHAGYGLLITIDEIQNVSDRMRQFATTYQHLLANGADIAVAMAGLPNAISDVLNDNVLTFLRRAHQVVLGSISYDVVLAGYKQEFEQTGFEVEQSAVEKMTLYTSGYPYLIQLLGFLAFNYAKDSKVLDMKTVEEAFESAKHEMQNAIYRPILKSLSDNDIKYLEAMAQDDGKSKTSTIAERMGTTAEYATVYRKRLIDAGIIMQTSRGYVTFGVPLLRDYLRNNGDSNISYGFEDYWGATV